MLILTKASASASTDASMRLQHNCVKTALLFRTRTYPEHKQPDILKVVCSPSSETQDICHSQTKEASKAYFLPLLPFIVCLLYIFRFLLILDLEWKKKISPGQTCWDVFPLPLQCRIVDYLLGLAGQTSPNQPADIARAFRITGSPIHLLLLEHKDVEEKNLVP